MQNSTPPKRPSPRSWLRYAILEPQGLHKPDGRALHAYLCSDRHFEECTEILIDATKSSPFAGSVDPEYAAMFCLFAAEWWQRNYSGGVWSWKGISTTVGMTSGNVGAECRSLTDAGLRWWGIERIQYDNGIRYLSSVATQGGLPAQLILKDASQVRSYLFSILKLRQKSVIARPYIELALEQSGLLPGGLQQDVIYELSALLVEAIANARQVIGEVTNFPLEVLNERAPEWQNNFPLRLTNSHAEALVVALLTDRLVSTPSDTTAIPFTTIRRLYRAQGSSWLPQTIVEMPDLVSESFICEQAELICSESLPSRLKVTLSVGSKTWQVGLLRRNGNNSQTWKFLSGVAGRHIVSGLDAFSEVQITVWGNTGKLFTYVPSNGLLLEDDLPLFFTDTLGAKDLSASRSLDLVAQGSASLSESEIIAAVDDSFTFDKQTSLPIADGKSAVEGVTSDADIQAFGTVQHQSKKLWQISSDVTIRSDAGANFSLSLNDEEVEQRLFSLSGNRILWSSHKYPVYSGLPRIRASLVDEIDIDIPIANIQWRPIGSRSAWRQVATEAPRGAVTVQVVECGIVSWSTKFVVLPRNAKLEVSTQGDSILVGISHANIKHLSVIGLDDDQLAYSDHDHESMVKFNSSLVNDVTFNVLLDWSKGERVSFYLNNPKAGLNFTNSQGTSISASEFVSIDQLLGMRVTVTGPNLQAQSMIAEFHDPKAGGASQAVGTLKYPLHRESNYANSLALGQFADEFNRMFSLSESLDCSMRLTVESRSPAECLNVRRFSLLLNYDQAEGVARLGNNNWDPKAIVFQGAVLEAVSLVEPKNRKNLGAHSIDGSWDVSDLDKRLAPWLLLCSEGTSLLGRPTVVPVADSNMPLKDDRDSADCIVSDASVVRAVICERSYPLRESKMINCLETMALDPGHSMWAYLGDTLKAFASIPIGSVDFLKHLCNTPRALVMGLLVLNGSEREALWSLAHRASFDWWLVPPEDWIQSSRTYELCWKSKGPQFAEIGATAVIENINAVTQAAPQIKTISTFMLETIKCGGVADPRNALFQVNFVLRGSYKEALAKLESDHRAEKDWPRRKHTLAWQQATSMGAWRQLEDENILGRLGDQNVIAEELVAKEAPIVCALLVASGTYLPADTRAYFLVMREFDAAWFDMAFEYILAWSYLYKMSEENN